MKPVIEYAAQYCANITDRDSFLPSLFRVVDSEGRLVCGATVDKHYRLKWSTPICNQLAREALRTAMKKSTCIYRRSRLSLTLVAPQYAKVAANLASTR